jgi:hypothetical protein
MARGALSGRRRLTFVQIVSPDYFENLFNRSINWRTDDYTAISHQAIGDGFTDCDNSVGRKGEGARVELDLKDFDAVDNY